MKICDFGKDGEARLLFVTHARAVGDGEGDLFGRQFGGEVGAGDPGAVDASPPARPPRNQAYRGEPLIDQAEAVRWRTPGRRDPRIRLRTRHLDRSLQQCRSDRGAELKLDRSRSASSARLAAMQPRHAF